MLAGCTSSKPPEEASTKVVQPETPEKPSPAPAATASGRIPDMYRVRLDTTKGPVVIEVHREWAPLGAERFHDLVEDKYFDGARFFRIVPNFIVQFGLAADPKMTRKWDNAIGDDPVLRTNAVGTVTFATAGPNTRTAQIFINLKSNQMLDSQGFAPFGRVVDGMAAVEKLYAGYGENPDQGLITRNGNSYLASAFPNLDYIRKATVLQ
jgi:peptidyl-prolyl cis-trans isomerase A (cyclophilin A)